jgi:predicted nucleotidyltransferase
LPIGQAQNEKLVQLVAKLKNAAATQIASVVLYGSSAHDDFQPEFSDLNVLLLLKDASAATLKQLAPVLKWWTQQGEPAPVLLQADELARCADVFAVELIDMKARHRLLEGDDLLAAIDVPRNMHRAQVERELRTALVKLRRGFVYAKNDDAVSKLMTESISTFATLFRHVLIIFGHAAPMEKRATIETIGAVLSMDLASLLRVLDIREKRAPLQECSGVFAEYLTAVTRVTDEVDRRLG